MPYWLCTILACHLPPPQPTSWLGPPLVAAALTVSATILLWLAKEWRSDLDERKKRAEEKEKFVRALYAEVDFNTHDMEAFIELSASLGEVTRKIKEKDDFIPHITDQRHKDVYKSQIGLLHHAGDDYIADVVTFYGVMEKIGTEIQGVYLSSYKTISPEGRVSVIDDIVKFAFECAGIGQSILAEMERSYPEYKLKRRKRRAAEVQSDADLRTRMTDLESDLNRARSTHGESP
ncbi:hypothetical protein ATY75_29080 [Rhizobium sp. N122]|uniref:hypothetical protein n=1 Tax=Rhizobium sp. N122 TaxID=1764272 RepID=UPI000B5AA3F8|nr:hypothetical protein [Rhizobium sp. N122]OWV78066.1 hypothetical protein ATY75_29080 [Rhizobium sp. N122]